MPAIEAGGRVPTVELVILAPVLTRSGADTPVEQLGPDVRRFLAVQFGRAESSSKTCRVRAMDYLGVGRTVAAKQRITERLVPLNRFLADLAVSFRFDVFAMAFDGHVVMSAPRLPQADRVWGRQ